MKKIFLIEDEWIHAEDIRISVEELNYEWLGYCGEGMAAMEKIRSLQPDVVLIDLNLNGSFSGLLIAAEVKKIFGLPFIFVTSYLDDDVIRRCIELNPVAYLHKPVHKGDLKAALIKAEHQQAQKEEPEEASFSGSGLNLLVRIGKSLKPLSHNDIIAIHSDAKNYVRIFSKGAAQYTVRSSLSALEKQLPTSLFIRVHKEYIINLKCISSVNEAEQTIQIDKLNIPLGRNFRSRFFSRYTIL